MSADEARSRGIREAWACIHSAEQAEVARAMELAATAAIEEYGPEIRGFLIGSLRSQPEADVVFAAWTVAVWKKLPGFAWRGPFRAWAYRVARSKLHDHQRKRTRELRRESLVGTLPPNLAEVVRSTLTRPYQQTGAKEWLARRLEELPEGARQLLMLRYHADMGFDEIALVMGGNAAMWRKRHERLLDRLHTDAFAFGGSHDQ